MMLMLQSMHGLIDTCGDEEAAILKGGEHTDGGGAPLQGTCKFLTCPAYVNEPFFPL